MTIENVTGVLPTDQLLAYGSDFELANTRAKDIGAENERFESASQLHAPFRSIVERSITREQTTTLETLSEAATLLPYEEVSLRALELERKKEKLQAQRESLAEEYQQQIDGIDDELRLATSLAPKSSDELVAASEKKKAKIKAEYGAAIDSEIAATDAELSALYDLGEIVWGSWEVPKVTKLHPEVVTEDLIEDFDGTTVMVDEIPVEPVLHDHNSIAEAVRREVENPDASHFIAYYLSQSVGQTVSVEQLAEFLYDVDAADATSDIKYRSRVTTLLGPKVSGRRIRDMLEAMNPSLELQYGWRTVKRHRGKGEYVQDGPPKRIYRAIRVGEAEKYRAIHITHDEEKADVVDQWLGGLRAKKAAERQVSTPVPAQSEGLAGQPEESDIPEQMDARVNNQSARERSPRRETWRSALARDVNAAIDQLIADGAFSEETISAGKLAALTSSKRLGTKESHQRLVDAGLASKIDFDSATMTVQQVVMSYIQNGHRDILQGARGTKLRRAAIKLVNDITSRRLEENKQVNAS